MIYRNKQLGNHLRERQTKLYFRHHWFDIFQAMALGFVLGFGVAIMLLK
jgi:hypothetical protein